MKTSLRPFRRFFFVLVWGPALALAACKSPPAPAPETPRTPPPRFSLELDHIEASDVDRMALFFTLRVENPRPDPIRLTVSSWRVLLDGRALGAEAAVLRALSAPGGGGGEGAAEGRGGAEGIGLEAPGAAAELPLVLDLDLRRVRDYVPGESPDTAPAFPGAGEGAAADTYRAALSLDLAYHYGGEGAGAETIGAAAEFPRVRKPEFTITEIAILQAELINTRFRVTVRIDNPNGFPVDLASFGYELYGAGRFWAGGAEKDVLHIPARDSSEVKLFLLMNFINMRRGLLDEVIAMRRVLYRFSGKVMVGTGVPWLPEFHMGFDRTGYSAVLK
ncbi:MAG: LEA type 2 family protein [Treponema sp.]|jgi:LEA14-like dessication related protein|nr:LEA type 2 family protein [Treponema sp.]